MTAPELRAWIDSLTQDIDFAYRGKFGSICPFHREDIALCYDGYAVDAHSVDEAMALPFICGHEVKPDKSGKDAIQPWELESDLRWLAENGYTTVVMADVIAYVRDGTPLPEKPIVLSFDDGYYNNYVYVLPLLRQYAARIVFSLLGPASPESPCRAGPDPSGRCICRRGRQRCPACSPCKR